MPSISRSLVISTFALLLSGPCWAANTKAPPVTASRSAAEQEKFFDRIQRSNERASRSICADGCKGTLKAGTQPPDPFAKLPDVDDVPSPVLPGIDN
jgi:hypothetical protein